MQRDGLHHALGDEPFDLRLAKLEPGQRASRLVVVAHAHFAETSVAQHALGLLDHRQFLRRDRLAVRDAGAETRHLRLVGGRQAQRSGESADVALGQAGLLERGAHFELLGRLGAGPVVADVAGVFAVGQYRETALERNRLEPGEQFMLAVVAAVDRVFGVVRIGKLPRVDNP